MKFEGKIMVGSNQAGKGDDDCSLKGDGRKSFRENYDNIFKKMKEEDNKKICSGCKEKKEWVYHLINQEGNFYYCEECKSVYLKDKSK